MNEALLEAFRHDAWANRHLLRACGNVPPDRLTSPSTGSYGSILETFNHIVQADASYLRRLAGTAPEWAEDHEVVDLDTLTARIEETAPLWDTLLSGPVDTERVIVVDQGVREVRAGVFVAQALHHGNAHREQICAILTGLGIEPPDVQPWEYAHATGRMWERAPRS